MARQDETVGLSHCWHTRWMCLSCKTYCNFDRCPIDWVANSPAMEEWLEALCVIGYVALDWKYSGCDALGNMGMESDREMDSAKHWRTNWNTRWADLLSRDKGFSPSVASNAR